MTKTVYLYGAISQEVIDRQNTIASIKIKYAYKLLRILMKPRHEHRDDARINAVIKAIKHNEDILEEIL